MPPPPPHPLSYSFLSTTWPNVNPTLYKNLFNISSKKWKNKWNQKKINLDIDLNTGKLETSLFVWLYKTIMQCLFNEVHQCFISSKKLQYQNIVVFKY